MATRTLTEASFSAAIERSGIVLVDWWAPWCGPCRAFAPIYEASAQAHADVTFATVDTQAEPGLAAAFAIRAIPTLMAFRDGILVFERPGMLSPQQLDRLVAGVQALDMEAVRRELATTKTA
jgi:thioredoxin